MAVLTASGSDMSTAGMEAALAKDPKATNEGAPIGPYMEAFEKWQAELVGLSSKSQRIVAAKTTTHALHFDEPQLAIDAIVEMLRA